MSLAVPAGLVFAYDGSAYFAETQKNLIRRIAGDGTLKTVAGSELQGFSGDSGPASDASLDAPSGLALDAKGNLFIADTHNRRVRRIDGTALTIRTIAGGGMKLSDGSSATLQALGEPCALAFDTAGDLFIADRSLHRVFRVDAGTQSLTTVAGDGQQGYGGDGNAARLAQLNAPCGLVVDGTGNLYIADTGNARVRVVDAGTRIIRTLAGTGVAGFAGDGGQAQSAMLSRPLGLALGGDGSLSIVDAGNQRIRRVDLTSGRIVTLAGDGVQADAGDGGPAVAASLNSPTSVAFSSNGLLTFTDTGNGRIRQIDAAGVLHPFAGLGITAGSLLTLAGPAVSAYGSGTLTARLVSSPAGGSVTFFDLGSTLTSVGLSGNAATLDLGQLAAGTHRISATYGGDATHRAAQSDSVSLTVAPASAVATPAAAGGLYGAALPVLTGMLDGILTRDSAVVKLVLTTMATVMSPAGAYPIAATLSGAAAANYTLTTVPASLTISPAPSVASLSAALAVHVAATTAGNPGGAVDLLDGSSVVASAMLNQASDTSFASSTLSAGSHTLTAAYRGDGNFLPSRSLPVIVSASPADFTLVTAGASTASTSAGGAAAFALLATPVNGVLVSPIVLSASGLPAGAVASFTPATIIPSATATPFTLTVQTLKVENRHGAAPCLWVLLLPLLCVAGSGNPRTRTRLLSVTACVALLGGLAGCGDRVVQIARQGSGKTYPITVQGTATSVSGRALQHSVTVNLVVN